MNNRNVLSQGWDSVRSIGITSYTFLLMAHVWVRSSHLLKARIYLCWVPKKRSCGTYLSNSQTVYIQHTLYSPLFSLCLYNIISIPTYLLLRLYGNCLSSWLASVYKLWVLLFPRDYTHTHWHSIVNSFDWERTSTNIYRKKGDHM